MPTPSPLSTIITFSNNDLNKLTRAAHKRSKKYANNPNPRYANSNTPTRHLRGLLGEAAMYAWLSRNKLPYNDVFADNWDQGTDHPNLETKCWDEGRFEDWGHCLTPEHATKYLRNGAKVVVWCRSVDDRCVELVGFSTPQEIKRRKAKPVGPYAALNHQVPLSAIHPMSELKAYLKEVAP